MWSHPVECDRIPSSFSQAIPLAQSPTAVVYT